MYCSITPRNNELWYYSDKVIRRSSVCNHYSAVILVLWRMVLFRRISVCFTSISILWPPSLRLVGLSEKFRYQSAGPLLVQCQQLLTSSGDMLFQHPITLWCVYCDTVKCSAPVIVSLFLPPFATPTGSFLYLINLCRPWSVFLFSCPLLTYGRTE